MDVRRWCQQRGLTLRITNGGHHSLMLRAVALALREQITGGAFLAEWWPSSAKLVIEKHWNKGVHCHDYKQALKVIEDFYGGQHS